MTRSCQAQVVIVEAGPKPTLGWLALAAAGLLLLGLVPADAIGRLLLLPAAGVLLGISLRDLLLRPTLSATPEGLTVVSGLRRVWLPWAEVHGLRVVTDRRAPLLEIDLGDTLVVLSRARLGAAPWQVLEQLDSLRAAL